MQSFYYGLCFVLGLLATPQSNAANGIPNNPLPIRDYYHAAWSGKDGAPTGVQAIAQTSDGMLWLGSHNGLYQFDGVRFRPVTRIGAIDLPTGEVYALLSSRNGDLWVSYLFGGIIFIRGNDVRHFTQRDGLPSGTITEFAEDQAGNVWSSSSSGLFLWNGNHWSEIGARLGLPKGVVRSIVIDPVQTVWLNLAGTITYLAKGSQHFKTAPWRIDGVTNPHISVSRDGVPWISTLVERRPAALRLSLGAMKHVIAGGIIWLPSANAAIDVVDSDGALWVNSGTSLARVTSSSRPTELNHPFKLAEQASGTGVQFGFEDREANIWLGTTGGVDRFRLSSIKKLPVVMGEITIVPGEHNTLWVGLERAPVMKRGLYQLDAGMILHRVPKVVGVSASLRTSDGTVWVGGTGGLWKYVGTAWAVTDMPVDLQAYPGSEVQSLTEDSERNLWASVTRHGVFRRTLNRWQPIAPPGIEPNVYPLIIDHDDKGAVYLGYSRDRISVWTKETLRTYTGLDGVAVGSVLAVGQVNGEVWIGGVRGIQRLIGSRFQPVRFDVSNAIDGVTGILQSRRGELWVNTTQGVIHVSAVSLAESKMTPDLPMHAELLNYLDGLRGSPTPIRPLPTLRETDDGRIWFTTTDGLFWTDPSQRPPKSIPPNVLITDVLVDRQHINLIQSPALPKYTSHLEIDYTVTSLAIPERAQFKYRLVGRDHDWHEVGGRRSAYFDGLPPGDYIFEVTASSADGKWNDVRNQIAFSIAVAVVQTAWFRALCAAAAGLLLLLVLVVRLRATELALMRRLEQHTAARVDDVTRISRELFDSLLQSFQGLMLGLAVLRQIKPSLSDEATRFLESAMRSGDGAIKDARESAQKLCDPSPRQKQLSDVLAILGNEFSGKSAAPRPGFQVIVEGEARPLNPLVSDAIYRIAREAIRNAFTHAQAQRIEAEISFSSSLVVIRIRDNGIGIDSDVLIQGPRQGHWGIPGMRECAGSLGSPLHIWSQPGNGTELELRISGKSAYAIQRLPWWFLIRDILIPGSTR